MSGATLKDLTKYHQGAMKWFKDGLVSEHNKLFAQTEDAGAVSFWPLGGTPLEGKVKFSFKETPPASGDKGPENPSTIAGVSSIAVGKCGKNLFPKNTVAYNYYGVTISYNSDGCLVFDGAYTGNVQRYYANTDGSSLFGSFVPCSMKLDPAKQYKFWVKLISGSISGASLAFTFGNKDHQMTCSSSNWSIGTVISLSVPVGYCDLFIFRTNINTGIVFDNAVLQIQLEEGTDITDFEPPMSASEIKTSIPLGDTYYGGEIDLATGVMTVTHYGTVLTGMVAADAYNGSGLLFLRSWPNGYDTDHISEHGILRPKKSSGIFCDRFPTSGSSDRFVIGNYNSTNQTEYLALYLNPETVGITESSLTGSEVRSKVNAYLANHPITIVYELYTPYTVQLTPLQLTALTQKDKYTPRLNTVYTDADSIQIRYRKSLIHDEDEKVQAIVALGGNV